MAADLVKLPALVTRVTRPGVYSYKTAFEVVTREIAWTMEVQSPLGMQADG